MVDIALVLLVGIRLPQGWSPFGPSSFVFDHYEYNKTVDEKGNTRQRSFSREALWPQPANVQ